jgi:AbrB family looped-hinge helix DNA binding protein
MAIAGKHHRRLSCCAMPSIKIQTRGRLTLPSEVRQSLGVEPGDRVQFVETMPGRFEVKAEPQRAGLLTKRAPVNRIDVPISRLNRQMKLPI